MAELDALRAAAAVALADGSDVVPGVCRACVAELPVDGAVFTAMVSDAARETLYASDAVADQTEQLQFSLGEGPCLQAFSTGRPVLIPDLAAVEAARWPIFAAVAADLPVGGLFAFPLQVGAISVGVVDVYRRAAGPLQASELARVLQVADLAALALLTARAGPPAEGLEVSRAAGAGSDHRVVHQATGMLLGQLGVGAAEALARLRGHAFAEGRLIDEVAADIVARRLRLDADPI